MQYLLKENLEEKLNLIFPEIEDWIRNKNFPGTRFRPDFRNDSLKLVIEFDGPMHYTDAKCIIRDEQKDKIIKANNYKIVRIPFFIQLDSSIIRKLFNKEVILESYPHGFISNDKTLVYPANFCELGIKRFIEELNYFSETKEDIVNSLKLKIQKEGDKRIVLPPSLFYLI